MFADDSAVWIATGDDYTIGAMLTYPGQVDAFLMVRPTGAGLVDVLQREMEAYSPDNAGLDPAPFMSLGRPGVRIDQPMGMYETTWQALPVDADHAVVLRFVTIRGERVLFEPVILAIASTITVTE